MLLSNLFYLLICFSHHWNLIPFINFTVHHTSIEWQRLDDNNKAGKVLIL